MKLILEDIQMRITEDGKIFINGKLFAKILENCISDSYHTAHGNMYKIKQISIEDTTEVFKGVIDGKVTG
jgi:hypothetical protein